MVNTIIYLPEGRSQKEQKLKMTSVQYKKWLTGKGDVVRILNLRRMDPDSTKGVERGTQAWADLKPVYYSPCVELYNGKEKVNFHFLGANASERAALDKWFTGLSRDKNGYVRIVDHRRKK